MQLKCWVCACTLVCKALGQTHHVDLTITDTVNPPTTMYNYYRHDGACPTLPPIDMATFTKLNPVPTVKTYYDATVTGGLTYCYVATAWDGASESEPSAPAEVIVPPYAPNVAAVAQ